MKQHKKEARAKDKLAELLGIENPKLEGPPNKVVRENTSRGAEASIAFIDRPKSFAKRQCRNCGQVFFVDRANVALCSDNCRAKELSSKGIEWDWSKPPEERWYVSYQGDKNTDEPLVVPPELVNVLQHLLDCSIDINKVNN